MKKIYFILALSLFAFACSDTSTPSDTSNTESTASEAQYFGDKIDESGAQPIENIHSIMGDDTAVACKLRGEVTAVCQTKGCWMELKNPSGEGLRVTFKDYGFFMPKDCAGKSAIVDGIAKIEVTSIADLKEYAKDDGKSKEEIDAITEPLKELVFEARGVILK